MPVEACAATEFTSLPAMSFADWMIPIATLYTHFQRLNFPQMRGVVSLKLDGFLVVLLGACTLGTQLHKQKAKQSQ
jgi:hypothetical protein